MAQHFDPIGQIGGTSPAERATTARKTGDTSSVKRTLSIDFEQALQALEKANAHVKSARISFQNADSARQAALTETDVPSRTTAPRRGLVDLSG